MIREAILSELKRRKVTRYWLMVESGVPRTVLYEFLNETRGVSIEHAEAMMKALGLVVARTK